MRLFLDTEFNGFGGKLISLALVAENGAEFYEVWHIPANPHPWVEEHVLPFLAIENRMGKPLNPHDYQEKLARFLMPFDGAEIIADWPSDFEHLCHMMTYAGQQAGWRIPINCTMRLIRSGDIRPEIPHNALSDARALRDWYLHNEAKA